MVLNCFRDSQHRQIYYYLWEHAIKYCWWFLKRNFQTAVVLRSFWTLYSFLYYCTNMTYNSIKGTQIYKWGKKNTFYCGKWSSLAYLYVSKACEGFSQVFQSVGCQTGVWGPALSKEEKSWSSLSKSDPYNTGIRKWVIARTERRTLEEEWLMLTRLERVTKNIWSLDSTSRLSNWLCTYKR